MSKEKEQVTCTYCDKPVDKDVAIIIGIAGDTEEPLYWCGECSDE